MKKSHTYTVSVCQEGSTRVTTLSVARSIILLPGTPGTRNTMMCPAKYVFRDKLFSCLEDSWIHVFWGFFCIIFTWIRKLGKELALWSLWSRPTQVPEYSTLVPGLFGTTSHCPSLQPFQLLPSRNIWRHISLTWLFPRGHQHAHWPVNVTELLHRICCWALILLSHHWAWLCPGIFAIQKFDWLIELFFVHSPHQKKCRCWEMFDVKDTHLSRTSCLEKHLLMV